MRVELKPIQQLKVTDKKQTLLITSASGLVKLQDSFLAIADDNTHIIRIDPTKGTTEFFLNLRDKPLPKDYKERKKQKPDWESITLVPTFPNERAILVTPSGSKPNRQLGYLVHPRPTPVPVFVPVDFSSLYSEIKKHFPEINIEGSVVVGNELKLFQRGNGALGQNGIISVNLAGLLADIIKRLPLNPKRIKKVESIDLGSLNGSRLSFTDVCPVGDKIFYVAVAEESNSTYEDGAYKGAVLGVLNKDSQIEFQAELNCPHKPEGLWIETHQQDQFEIWIVTDADHPELSSGLYRGILKI